MGVTTRSQAKRQAEEDSLRLQNQPTTSTAPANNNASASSQPRTRRQSTRQAKLTAASADHKEPQQMADSAEPQSSESDDRRAVLYPKHSNNLGEILDIIHGLDYEEVGRSFDGQSVFSIYFPSLDADRMTRLQTSNDVDAVYYYAEHPELLETMPAMGVLEFPIEDEEDDF